MIQGSFVKRCFFLIGLQMVLLLALLVRMYVLQIIEGAHYTTLAEGNRIAISPLLPLRGDIFDRNGVPLALNKKDFRVMVLADNRADIVKAIESVDQLISLPQEEKTLILEKAKKSKILEPFIIKEHLTWNEVATLELHTADIPGIDIEMGYERTYPQHHVGAHVLGYVGALSQKAATKYPYLSHLKIGKQGVEKYLNPLLRGTPGSKQYEVNARRKIVRDLTIAPAKKGEHFTLTLDASLQKFMQNRLKDFKSASAVVLDIKSGHVLGFISHPTFDPNFFPSGISHKEWNKLRDNPYAPLHNKALSGLYAPGSTIKTLVILAALKAGIIDKDTTVFCPGHTMVGNHKFHCWKHHGHGAVNAERAIRESCDVYLYEIAQKVGIDRITPLFRLFGLGDIHLGRFPGEKGGLVPGRAWKKSHKDSSWLISDTVQTSIGQGYVLATPLQLAVMAARLASGKSVEPTLLHQDQRTFPSLSIEKDDLSLVQEGMKKTVNHPRGTGYRWRIQDNVKAMAGKTGSSQVRRITLKDRKAGLTRTAHLAWKYREHGLFVGYAPLDNPRYAIAVVIEHAGGASHATHVARDILQEVQSRKQEVVHVP